MDCPLCLEECEHSVILCKNGHSVCTICKDGRGFRTSLAHRCPTCREPLLRTFIPNRPLDQALVMIRAKEKEIGDAKHALDLG